MSCPLSSLVNPLDKEQVLLYYLSSNQTPALELHHVGAEKTTATAFADNLSAPVDSKIVNPGSFSALYNEKLLNLYGLVQSAPQKGTAAVDAIAPKRLAQLSPVYKLLLPDGPTNTVIGVAMTTIVAEGQGYIYCMTGTEEKPRITEFSIGWSSQLKRRGPHHQAPRHQATPGCQQPRSRLRSSRQERSSSSTKTKTTSASSSRPVKMIP